MLIGAGGTDKQDQGLRGSFLWEMPRSDLERLTKWKWKRIV